MFQYHCLNPIAEKGLGLFDEEYKKSEDLQECDAVLVRSAKMHDMELPESVKVIARAGAGVNNIPVKDCAEKGVVVFNTPGANANGVKELVLAGMLLASRDIVGGIEWVAKEKDQEDIDKLAEKQKKQFAGCEIMGKKLGIIGLGAIGAMVANAASALGMEVYGYDPYISVNAAWSLSRNVNHVNAVEEINKKYGETIFTLDIYGQIDSMQTEWFELLQSRFSKDISYKGLVPFDKSTDILKNYYALLFPTRFYTEGIPGTIIDAYASGVPVISAKWESFNDLVNEKIVGYGYTFGNYNELIKCLSIAMENSYKWNQMKKNCLVQAEKYSARYVLNRLIEKL